MSPSRAWQVATVGFLALFAFTIVESLQLSLRDALGPGPGFFPFWLGVAGGLLAILLLVQAHRGRAPVPAGPLMPPADARRRVLAVVAALLGATLLLDPLGFRLTLALFCAGVLLALGIRRAWVVAVFALAGGFGVFHIFYHWLKVPLPIGLLGI
jgi:putative tricarboxylic transport membrane protein